MMAETYELPKNHTGPEQIRPTTTHKSIDRDGAIKLNMKDDDPNALIPMSVPRLLQLSVEFYPNHSALAYKDSNHHWVNVTYKEYKDKTYHAAKAFIKLGLEAKNAVGILSFNCPEWFYSEMGAIHAGGIVAGIYTTNSPEAVFHVLEDSNANIVVVDDPKQMAKIVEIRSKLPNLKAAIQINGPLDTSLTKEGGYYRWSDIEKMDVNDMEPELAKRLQGIAINECCALIYTSGTVGYPKGVMLTHDNVTWIARNNWDTLDNVQYGKESIVSYLPLNHVAGQMGDVFMGLAAGGTIYFADRNALKGTLANTLTEVRPTRFGGVPRVFEKIQEKFVRYETKMSGLQRKILNWAKSVALEHHMQSEPVESFQYKLARYWVLSKIKTSLGLDRAVSVVCGAAPCSIETKKFFLSLDIPITESYGLSESSGCHCLATRDSVHINSVGKPLPNVETRVSNPDPETGYGELCIRGRHVFMGYLDNEEKTSESLDDEGWLHTGDIGFIDKYDNIFITGRLKELIITAGGENIPPVHVENLVKKQLPALSSAFVIGDKRKFLTMLVTLKTDMNLDTGYPLDTLNPEALAWIKSLDLSYTTVTEIIEGGPCPKVLEAIENGITRANKEAISNAQKVQKFALLPRDFSIPTGELGPTLKVKRNVVVEMYKDIIDKFYVD